MWFITFFIYPCFGLVWMEVMEKLQCYITSCDIMPTLLTYILIVVGVDVRCVCSSLGLLTVISYIWKDLPTGAMLSTWTTFDVRTMHASFDRVNLQSQVTFQTKFTQSLFAATFYVVKLPLQHYCKHNRFDVM